MRVVPALLMGIPMNNESDDLTKGGNTLRYLFQSILDVFVRVCCFIKVHLTRDVPPPPKNAAPRLRMGMLEDPSYVRTESPLIHQIDWLLGCDRSSDPIPSSDKRIR